MTSAPEPRKSHFIPSPEAIQAVLAAIVMKQGEPLIEPTRIVLSIARSDVERAANRPITFDYVVDELNPYGRLDIIVTD